MQARMMYVHARPLKGGGGRQSQERRVHQCLAGPGGNSTREGGRRKDWSMDGEPDLNTMPHKTPTPEAAMPSASERFLSNHGAGAVGPMRAEPCKLFRTVSFEHPMKVIFCELSCNGVGRSHSHAVAGTNIMAPPIPCMRPRWVVWVGTKHAPSVSFHEEGKGGVGWKTGGKDVATTMAFLDARSGSLDRIGAWAGVP